jgi:hypothetical protein
MLHVIRHVTRSRDAYPLILANRPPPLTATKLPVLLGAAVHFVIRFVVRIVFTVGYHSFMYCTLFFTGLQDYHGGWAVPGLE